MGNAMWEVRRNGDGSQFILYSNLCTGQVHNCHPVVPMPAEVTEAMVLGWIVEEGQPNPGELILLEGRPFIVMFPGANA